MDENLDLIALYMNDIKNYFEKLNQKNEILSMDELIELQKEYFKGNKKAREKIIICNQRLVYKIARKHSNDEEELLTNIQNGNIGLIRAIDKFDASMGYTFSTYATYLIESKITRNKIDYKSIRVSENLKITNKKIDEYIKSYYLKNGKKPTKEEIVNALSLKPYSIQSYYDSQYKLKSLNDIVNKDCRNKTEFIDMMESENNNILDKENEIYNEELRRTILDIMDYRLNSQEKLVITKLFGLDGNEAMTLKEVSEEIGVTHQRIGYIKQTALQKLKVNSKLKTYAKML